MGSYEAFIESKLTRIPDSGFDAVGMNDMLFDFKKDIVAWACRKGKAAIFADCGMGKTPMQLEWARQVHNHTGGNVLTGDIVLSPFMGIGSEGYCSIKKGRRFIGIELKASYFNCAVKNLDAAVAESQALTLFDMLKVTA